MTGSPLWLSITFCCPVFTLSFSQPQGQPTRSPRPVVFASSSLSWGCSLEKKGEEKSAHEVLRAEYRKLGPLSFAEINVLLCFFLLVGLWFTRDPGFMPGWVSIAWAEGKTK